MKYRKDLMKTFAVLAMIVGILCLHYFTLPGHKYHHAFYRMLFYLPLLLGSFWFGLKKAIGISAIVTLLYLPYVITQWQGFSFEDFDKLLEGVLYVTIAFILGFLIHREREKHRALVQSESLAAIGRAFSEVAHDMKTPLVAIGGFANQVSKDLKQDDHNRKKLEVVILETARLENMVKSMLDFGKPIEIKTSETNLNDLVLESIEVARATAKQSDIELNEDLDPALPPISLDPGKIKQVILNLIANGIQASSAGEKVLAKTHAEEKSAILEVTDHGCGIEEEHRERVFHPFVSTKKAGTGLGLAIVKKIMDAHGGKISFRPNTCGGVTFTVRFPYEKISYCEEFSGQVNSPQIRNDVLALRI